MIIQAKCWLFKGGDHKHTENLAYTKLRTIWCEMCYILNDWITSSEKRSKI